MHIEYTVQHIENIVLLLSCPSVRVARSAHKNDNTSSFDNIAHMISSRIVYRESCICRVAPKPNTHEKGNEYVGDRAARKLFLAGNDPRGCCQGDRTSRSSGVSGTLTLYTFHHLTSNEISTIIRSSACGYSSVLDRLCSTVPPTLQRTWLQNPTA